MCLGVVYLIATVLLLIALHTLCEIAQKAENESNETDGI
jgi:hypothetical protein